MSWRIKRIKPLPGCTGNFPAGAASVGSAPLPSSVLGLGALDDTGRDQV